MDKQKLDSKEEHYGILYHKEPISNEMHQAINAHNPDNLFDLPQRNIFIAEDLTILPKHMGYLTN